MRFERRILILERRAKGRPQERIMKELSLNILDIAQNSIKAGATHLEIKLDQKGPVLTVPSRTTGTA
jgi:septum formation topological specificity factor MinE